MRIEMYFAVTVLYFISAFAINRLAAAVERACAPAGRCWARSHEPARLLVPDDWNVVSELHPPGLVFSVELTLVAMFGGIVIGTLIALMRLSSQALAGAAGRGLRRRCCARSRW